MQACEHLGYCMAVASPCIWSCPCASLSCVSQSFIVCWSTNKKAATASAFLHPAWSPACSGCTEHLCSLHVPSAPLDIYHMLRLLACCTMWVSVHRSQFITLWVSHLKRGGLLSLLQTYTAICITMWLSQSAAASAIVADTSTTRQPHCKTALLRSFTD